MRAFVSRSEYARHRGVKPPLVSQWGKQGRLVLSPDGLRVDVEKTDALLAEALDPARGGRRDGAGRFKKGETEAPPERAQRAAPAAAPPPQSPPAQPPQQQETYHRVRTFREGFNAKSAEVDYRKKIGELVERELYNRALSQNIGPTIQRLFSMSARIGARVASEMDVRKCQDIIDDEAHSIAQEIADYAQALIEGAGGKTKQ